jgi:hypothetical protein
LDSVEIRTQSIYGAVLETNPELARRPVNIAGLACTCVGRDGAVPEGACTWCENLSLSSVTLTVSGPDGISGARGTDGDPGANGGSGVAGENGCARGGAPGGTVADPSGEGGPGGQSVFVTGQDGNRGTPIDLSGRGGFGAVMYTADSPSMFYFPPGAEGGFNGTTSTAVASGGTAEPIGLIPRSAGAGLDGASGGSGGGGGGAPTWRGEYSGYTFVVTGAAGGGGAAGGCGGRGGGGGAAGAGAIGLRVHGARFPRVDRLSVNVTAGRGGDGGAGGSGGPGATGGAGATPFSCYYYSTGPIVNVDCPPSGAGGASAPGNGGGGGAGGNGGWCIGVYRSDFIAELPPTITYTGCGSAAAGAPGGAGGTGFGGGTAGLAGSPGVAGEAHAVYPESVVP